tara:strand:+ start:10 stop:1152 length:1143 start_codon:yes stop_codon:yes gene_type:complete
MEKFDGIIDFIREVFRSEDPIPLHAPVFRGNEKLYLNQCIDSTYVSSVGNYVDAFEEKLAEYVGVKRAVLCVNGTNAIHLCLIIAGVEKNDEVLTQPLTFVATVNAITYAGAVPVFIDVDRDSLGLSPVSLKKFLDENALLKNGKCFNRHTNRRIKACLPMHTFGRACRIDEILEICDYYRIQLVEDAAEAMGSLYKGRHLGSFGLVGAISFNGNKIMTTGGGGVIVTNDNKLGLRAKHLATQAKLNHPWEYQHDEIGYNYRMPNLNAALGLAQLEQLPEFIKSKRQLANDYKDFFHSIGYEFLTEREEEASNYWLNAILFNDLEERDLFLNYSNQRGIMSRPIWKPMHSLTMFNNNQSADLTNTEWLYSHIVNLPSGVR